MKRHKTKVDVIQKHTFHMQIHCQKQRCAPAEGLEKALKLLGISSIIWLTKRYFPPTQANNGFICLYFEN
jgi:hypothetical protein